MDDPAISGISCIHHSYRFMIHDRDSIFSPTLDEELKGFGVRVLKTPVRAPKADAFCERLIGTIRRECLDYLIPLNERHLNRILKEYVGSLRPGSASFVLGTWNSGTNSGRGS